MGQELTPGNSATQAEPLSQITRPTFVRWQVMACITLVTMLTYLDRLNLGIAAKFINDEFHFGTQTMGWILSAFVLGYSLFQIPGGWLGDRIGPRNVLAAAIVLWSIFTALTALAPRLAAHGWISVAWAFIAVRFLVGAGEAATSPNGNKIVGSWMRASARGTGASFTILGVGLGGAITPPLIAWIMLRYGWRTSFYFAGLLGLIVVVLWLALVTNSPEENPRVNRAELDLIRAGQTTEPLAVAAAASRASTAMGENSPIAISMGTFLRIFLPGLSDLFLPYLVFLLPHANPPSHYHRGRLLGRHSISRDRCARTTRRNFLGFRRPQIR